MFFALIIVFMVLRAMNPWRWHRPWGMWHRPLGGMFWGGPGMGRRPPMHGPGFGPGMGFGPGGGFGRRF